MPDRLEVSTVRMLVSAIFSGSLAGELQASLSVETPSAVVRRHGLVRHPHRAHLVDALLALLFPLPTVLC